MTKKKLLVAGLCMLIFTSCNNNVKDYTTENKQAADTSATREMKAADIPFIVAKNYFTKNTVERGGLENQKIGTKENFVRSSVRVQQ